MRRRGWQLFWVYVLSMSATSFDSWLGAAISYWAFAPATYVWAAEFEAEQGRG